jgi:hypothetical protein
MSRSAGNSAGFPDWRNIDFSDLEFQAMRERDQVEFWRVMATIEILAGVEYRAGAADGIAIRWTRRVNERMKSPQGRLEPAGLSMSGLVLTVVIAA